MEMLAPGYWDNPSKGARLADTPMAFTDRIPRASGEAAILGPIMAPYHWEGAARGTVLGLELSDSKPLTSFRARLCWCVRSHDAF